MKKIMVLLLLAAGFMMSGCNNDSQSNEFNPLALMSNYGPYTLTVNVTYDGTAPDDGSGKIYVYLFDTLGLTSRDPIYAGSTDAAYAGGVAAINVEHIKAGDYYVLVFFDYAGGDNPDNRYDRYIFYSGTGPVGFASQATVYTVTGDATIGGTIGFEDTYQLQGQSTYMLPCTLTVNATYNGTAYTSGTGTGRIYVYLYESLGSDTRTPAPVWSGSTPAAVTIGEATPITLTNFTAGNYYVMVLYDFNNEAGHPDSEGDRYWLYNDKQYVGQATSQSFGGGNINSFGAIFGDSYTLQTGSAFMTAPVTLTVKATYNGTGIGTGTGNMYVYLYGSLARGTRLGGAPSYTGSVAASVGSEATVTIPGVDQGYYYVLVFYDYASGTNADSATDRYIIYDGDQYPANANIVLLDSDRELNGITFGDSYTFQTNVVGDTLYMQPGSLTVSAAYTGTPGTLVAGSDANANYIYVYLYDSLGTGTRNPLPIYTGSTGVAISDTNPHDITINNIFPGNYYVVVFYNFAASGATNPDTRYDRYVIYDNVEFPASPATPFNVLSGSNSITGVSFGDGFQLNSGAAFN